MAHKTLIDGTAYQVKGGRTLIDGTGYKITKGRTLIGGTGYDIKFGTPIGELAVGTSVYMNVNGVRTEFLVVNQGIPENHSHYDESCNGTWLLAKDIYENRAWHTEKDVNIGYGDSSIHAYLNGAFLNMFDTDVKSIIKQVKIPFKPRGSALLEGASGVPTKIFLLSLSEVGVDTSTLTAASAIGNEEGAKLSYFIAGKTTEANERRLANYNGASSKWWLRSKDTGATDDIWYVTASSIFGGGYVSDITCSNGLGIRPALILSSEQLVDGDFNVLAS